MATSASATVRRSSARTSELRISKLHQNPAARPIARLSAPGIALGQSVDAGSASKIKYVESCQTKCPGCGCPMILARVTPRLGVLPELETFRRPLCGEVARSSPSRATPAPRCGRRAEPMSERHQSWDTRFDAQDIALMTIVIVLAAVLVTAGFWIGLR